MKSRKELLRACKKERPAVTKTPSALQLDSFLDKREASSSIQVDSTFNVGTLNRSRMGSRATGGAVMLLDPPEAGGVFGNKDVIPDFDLIAKRNNDILESFKEAGVLQDGHEYVAEDEDFHPYRGVSRPKTFQMKRPATLDIEDTTYLTPQQRRENFEFLKRATKAKELMKQVEYDRNRALQALQYRYQKGVIGVDTEENIKSPVYGERASQLERIRARTAHARLHRAQVLNRENCSVVRRGYDFLKYEENGSRTEDTQSMFPRKRRVDSAPGKDDDTHQRLFARDFARIKGVRRSQALKRDFDIVTGVQVPERKPPRTFVPELF